jgi:uncharacterized protein GlcG (DUF336 family)
MTALTLEIATRMAQIAFAEGEARGITKMSIVVTDAGGHIRLAMRNDAQGNFGVETAQAKCTAALGFNRSSLALASIFANPAAVAGLQGAVKGRFLPLGGAVVVADGDNNILGAAGISGGLPEVDHAVIVKAVEEVGLHAMD